MSCVWLVDALKGYFGFMPAQLPDKEKEFTILQSTDVSYFPKEAVNEATIRLMMMETLKFTGVICCGTMFSKTCFL